MADPDTGRFGTPGADAPGTPAERTENKALMEALAARKEALGAAAQLPTEDKALSERILGEARQRSEQISASRNPVASGRVASQSERIPGWLWIAWAVAIGGSVAAYFWLT